MTVFIKNIQKIKKLDFLMIKQVSQKILDYLSIEDKELSLVLVDDKLISKINLKYFNKNKPTNVISFSMLEEKFEYFNSPISILGDIIISIETVFRDASKANLNPLDELIFLIIHGILHIIGFDHYLKKEQKIMEHKELEIFFFLKSYKYKR